MDLLDIIAGRKAEVRMLTEKVTGLFRTVVSLYRYLYRKVKPPFFLARGISPDRRVVNLFSV